MRTYTIAIFLCLLCFLQAAAQPPCKIQVQWPGYAGRQVQLGFFLGNQVYPLDSILLDATGKGSYTPAKQPGSGIYVIWPEGTNPTRLFFIDSNCRFSIIADSAGLRFEGSPENSYYAWYQNKMAHFNSEMSTARKLSAGADSLQQRQVAAAYFDSIQSLRQSTVTLAPRSLLAAYLRMMREPIPPAGLDRDAARQFVRRHFWDEVAFYDGRMARAPFLESKLEQFFGNYVPPDADSVIREADRMLAYASASEDMQRFLLAYFLNRASRRARGFEDQVLLHMYERYIAGSNLSWMLPQVRSLLESRVRSIRSTSTGSDAPAISAPDSSGQLRALASINAPYTLVIFWDATCNHCRELLPAINRLYLSEWKAKGLQIYAISRESDGTPAIWRAFIREQKLGEWVHVYYSLADDAARTKAGLPGYGTLYDVRSIPALYLLDAKKRVIARKITAPEITELLRLRQQR